MTIREALDQARELYGPREVPPPEPRKLPMSREFRHWYRHDLELGEVVWCAGLTPVSFHQRAPEPVTPPPPLPPVSEPVPDQEQWDLDDEEFIPAPPPPPPIPTITDEELGWIDEFLPLAKGNA